MAENTWNTIREAAEYITGKNFWEAGTIRFSDGPAGLRMQKKGADSMGLKKAVPASAYPAHSALACSWNRSLAEGVGRRIGEEAAALGVDVLLAPALNIKRNPLNGRNFEYFSEDAFLTAEMGVSYINGVQSAGVGACVKHFAANNKETGRSVSDSVVSERTLNQLYLPAFEAAVKRAAPAAVMTSYNKINGVYCNENRALIEDTLRKRWGFKGFVVSDWGGVNDRVASVKAGADLEMPSFPLSTELILAAVERGELSEEQVFACADRIKAFENRVKADKMEYDPAEHAEYAVKAAEECIVLLKNNGALPLAAGQRVAIFGEAAVNAPVQGGGSSHVQYNIKVKNFLTAASEKLDISGFRGGYKRLDGRARRLIANSDAIIYCLAAYGCDSEGDDKIDLSIPDDQTALLGELSKTGKKIICVLTCGGAVDASWDKYADALLCCGLCGQGAAEAAVNIISGKCNPSGRLAETFFNAKEELPSTAGFHSDPYVVYYSEGCAVGYRYYLNTGIRPKYPFGFGLGYTTFEYTQPEINEDGAAFTLSNTGAMAGAETAQIYIEFPREANECSPMLVGFEKVFLNPGEKKRVFIPFGENTFRSYDSQLHEWVRVGGVYNVYISENSFSPKLSAEISISGNSNGVPPDSLNASSAQYKLKYNKRGRVIAELTTPFGELRNSRAFLVRLTVKCALFFTKKNATLGGTLRYATIRMGAQFSAFNSRQTEGLLQMFNGKYFRGLWKIITKNKKTKKQKV